MVYTTNIGLTKINNQSKHKNRIQKHQQTTLSALPQKPKKSPAAATGRSNHKTRRKHSNNSDRLLITREAIAQQKLLSEPNRITRQATTRFSKPQLRSQVDQKQSATQNASTN
jgi:hypothetical protein